MIILIDVVYKKHQVDTRADVPAVPFGEKKMRLRSTNQSEVHVADRDGATHFLNGAAADDRLELLMFAFEMDLYRS